MEIVSRALEYATRQHEGQLRKSGEPYVCHVIRVQERLAAAGFGTMAQAVGLLHDVFEDTDARFPELRHRFGSQIACRVSALSKLRRGPDQSKSVALSRARLRLFLLGFAAFAADHADVLAVKMADQIDNLTDVAAVQDRLSFKQAEVREMFMPIYRHHRFTIDPALRPGYDSLLAQLSCLCEAPV